MITPRTPSGEIDFGGLERNIDLLVERGATGLVLTGGTGEYFDLSLDARLLALERAVAFNAGRLALIASNGGARLEESVALADHALAAGADAVLLPPPHFYRYGQRDLEAFYREAGRRINGPLLIYNLAGFVSPIETETVVRLIEDVDNIVGVKDSSGSTTTLETLTVRGDLDAIRIIGHDGALVKALERGWLDAVISGPAGVTPEVIVGLFRAREAGDEARFRQFAALLAEALDRLDAMPYPWALKRIAELRGLFKADLPFPPSEESGRMLRELDAWFGPWLEQVAALSTPRLHAS